MVKLRHAIAVIGLVRFPFLLAIAEGADADRWIYHIMLAPSALLGAGTVLLLPAIGAGRMRWRRPRSLAPFARYAGVNWMATLASQAAQFVLPLVVAQSVAPEVNASFFLAWMVTSIVLLVPGAIAQVLLVEGSRDAHHGRSAADGHDRAREALVISLAIAALALVGSVAAGPIAVVIFGDEYRRLADLLPALMAAGIPWAVTAVRLSEARIRRDVVGHGAPPMVAASPDAAGAV